MAVAKPSIGISWNRDCLCMGRLIGKVFADGCVDSRDVLLQKRADGLTDQRRRHLFESGVILLRRSSSIAGVSRWVGFVLRVRRDRGGGLLVMVLGRYIVIVASGRQFGSVRIGCVYHFEGDAVRTGCHIL